MPGPLTPRTAAPAGALLAAAAAVLLVSVLVVQVPLDHGAVLPLHGTATSVVVAVLRLAAFVLLAVGVRGEGGAAGASLAGAVALIVFGARDVLFRAEGLLPAAAPLPVNAVLGWGVAAAGLVAAVAVLRAGVLHGVARTALLLAAVIEVPTTAASWIPAPQAVPVPLFVGALELLFLLQWALLLVLGGALLLHGRGAAVRHRLRAVHDAW